MRKKEKRKKRETNIKKPNKDCNLMITNPTLKLKLNIHQMNRVIQIRKTNSLILIWMKRETYWDLSIKTLMDYSSTKKRSKENFCKIKKRKITK